MPFKVAAPDQLVGLPRQEVRLIDRGGSPGALVTYGQGLGGIAVIQAARRARGKDAASRRSAAARACRRSRSTAPTGEELDTALGTVLRFQRGGVDYTVLGSVPPAAAEAAARAL